MNRMHQFLLLAVLPLTVLWIPVYQATFGTLTLLDVAFICLWPTTLMLYHRRRRWRDKEFRLAIWICFLASAPAVLGILATMTFRMDSPWLSDFCRHMKRFGMPSILPLAVLVSGETRIRRYLLGSILVAVLFMNLVAFTPLRDVLPINTRVDRIALGERNVGSISNPNDFSYVGILASIVALALRHETKHRPSIIQTGSIVLCGLAAVMGGASRSGLVAVVGAVLFMVMRRRLSVARVSLLVTGLVAALTVGWGAVPEFKARVESILDNGISEQNVQGRVEAQRVALRTAVHHPFGVGFVNMASATREYSSGTTLVDAVYGSDSLYCDFLLATGLLGFLAVVWTLRVSYSLVSAGSAHQARTYFLAGVIASVLIGFATTAPASVFVAPFFFMLVAVGGAAPGKGMLRREYLV